MLQLQPGQPEWHTHENTRHGTTSLFAALDVATGTVIAACHHRHRAREFQAFLNTIHARVPAELDIPLILDNYATHKAPTVKRWLAQRSLRHGPFMVYAIEWTG